MAGEGYAYLGVLACFEVAAVLVGMLGAIHTSDLGGRWVSLFYAVPTVVLALVPPVQLWGFTGGFTRWHLPILLPLLLASLCVYHGFRRRQK